jgi:sec-independent protein translocase protein TatB
VFNLDWSEILVLVVLAVIIFGPERLPELARKAGRIVRYLRAIANDATGRLQAELGPEFADLDLRNPRELVTKHLIEPVQTQLEPLKAELEPLKAGLDPRHEAAAEPAEPAAELVEAGSTVAFDPEAT